MPNAQSDAPAREFDPETDKQSWKSLNFRKLVERRAILRNAAWGILLGAEVISPVCEASAESLAQVLASAYANNPTIRAERARQRATDEQVPQALSGWRPTVTASSDAGLQYDDSNTILARRTQPAGFSIKLNQPIFRGFRTVNETNTAESNVKAGRQNLLAVEQQVLFDVAVAFMNVIRDRKVLRLRGKNVSFLSKQLRAARARLRAGDITRTDVSQANARLSLSRSNLAIARSNLQASRANFVRLVGHQPTELTSARVLQRLPNSLKNAIAIAERTNPDVLAALHVENASRHNVEAVKGNLLPTLSLQARYELHHDPSTTTRTSERATILGALTIPLYQAGRVYSQVREAKQVASQRRLQILETNRRVRENVVTAWHALFAAYQTIRSFSDQVHANRLALDGVRKEALAGSRTVLDVLDAEQELVDSQISLAGARREIIVAAYRLLASIGRMTAHDLDLPVSAYDPSAQLEATRGRLFGTNTETVE